MADDQYLNSETNSMLNTHRASGMPEIKGKGQNLAVTTTNIEVFANGMKVGFVQSLNPTEQRGITKVQELGTEGVVQSVPHNTQGGQLSLTRLAVYNANLFNAVGANRSGGFTEKNNFESGGTKLGSELNSSTPTSYSNPFKTLKDQRVPLEFKVKTKMPNNVGSFLTETYIDCWLSSYSKTVAANTITVSEQATVQYSDVKVNYTNGE